MATKEELLEQAKALDVEGRSGMNKEELEKAVAEAEAAKGSSDESEAEEAEGLSPEGEEALEAMEDESAELAATELDSSGPLHLQHPAERVMTGAVNEEHAKELEEKLADAPEDFAGEVSEAGFSEDGSAAHVKAEEEKTQEDVIDYEAYEAQAEDKAPADPNAKLANSAGWGSSDVAGGGEYGRVFAQKAVFYTDGLGGAAESNLERAYEIPEILQSSDAEEREAGDESLSEGAEKSAEEQKLADDVKNDDE